MQIITERLPMERIPTEKLRKGISLCGELLFLTSLFIFAGQLAASNATVEMKMIGYVVLAGLVVLYSEAKLAYHRFITKLEKTANDLESISESLESITKTVEEVQEQRQNREDNKQNNE